MNRFIQSNSKKLLTGTALLLALAAPAIAQENPAANPGTESKAAGFRDAANDFVRENLSEEAQKAFAALKQKAEKGDVAALAELGEAHVKGAGTPVDYEKALLCYEQSAKQGSVDRKSVV